MNSTEDNETIGRPPLRGWPFVSRQLARYSTVSLLVSWLLFWLITHNYPLRAIGTLWHVSQLCAFVFGLCSLRLQGILSAALSALTIFVLLRH
jgi:small-conductance mechanosensitive channel